MKMLKPILLTGIIVALLASSPLSALVEIKNGFLKVIGDETSGRFVIKTTDGDPDLSADQNKLLLYEEYPPTSYAVVRIDGREYKFGDEAGSFTQPIAVVDNTLVCRWTVNNVRPAYASCFSLATTRLKTFARNIASSSPFQFSFDRLTPVRQS